MLDASSAGEVPVRCGHSDECQLVTWQPRSGPAVVYASYQLIKNSILYYRSLDHW